MLSAPVKLQSYGSISLCILWFLSAVKIIQYYFYILNSYCCCCYWNRSLADFADLLRGEHNVTVWRPSVRLSRFFSNPSWARGAFLTLIGRAVHAQRDSQGRRGQHATRPAYISVRVLRWRTNLAELVWSLAGAWSTWRSGVTSSTTGTRADWCALVAAPPTPSSNVRSTNDRSFRFRYQPPIDASMVQAPRRTELRWTLATIVSEWVVS